MMLMTVDDVLNTAMTKTTVLVGEELLNNSAILLPSVHDVFNIYVGELLTAKRLEVGVEANKSVSSSGEKIS